MAINPTTTVRLRPVIIAYLDELARIGAYGKGRSGVMRRFIENGIAQAVERGVIDKKNAANFGEGTDAADDDD